MLLFLFYFLPTVSFAAGVFLAADKKTFAQNESFLVSVYLDTEGKSVNAVDGSVLFSPEYLNLKEIRDGNSALNFWLERPHSLQDGQVSFSGITTGGFSGSKRFLFSLVFESKKQGNSLIDTRDINVLQNDGLGTKLSLKETPFTFSISKEINGKADDLSIKDTNPPESFIPFITNDKSILEGKNFLVFSTVDKGSGIDHYEVRERFWPWGGTYVVAESPYLLKDQSLKDRIYVKAVDKMGNYRIEELAPLNRLALLEQFIIVVIIMLSCILIFKKVYSRAS